MAPKIQHKRSAVAGKQPLPTDLEYGEIAVNYEATDPALYIKDSANAVRKIGNQPDATATVKGIDTQKWSRTGTTLSPATTGDLLAPAVMPAATTTAQGAIQLATAAEVLAGTDLVKAVTPKEAKDHYLAKNIALLPALP